MAKKTTRKKTPAKKKTTKKKVGKKKTKASTARREASEQRDVSQDPAAPASRGEPVSKRAGHLLETARRVAKKTATRAKEGSTRFAEFMRDDLAQTKKDLESLGESTREVAGKVTQGTAETTRKVLEGAGEGLLSLSKKMNKKKQSDD